MKVEFQQIKEITTGAVRIEEKNDGVHFYRFTTEQEELYRQTNEDYYKRTFTTAGVRLCFQTTSRILMLRVFTRACLTRQFFSFDVFVNDHCVGRINNFTECELPIDYTTSSFPMGSFEKTFELGDGTKTVDVFFPWSVEAVLQSMALDDNCLINPVKPNKRLLMFGDSITQGYDTLFPSKHYSVKLSKLLDAEIINKAIGGEVFFPALANTRERFQPDYITVAYGTNDWSKKNREDLLENARKFYSTLQQAYPDAPIFAMLPIWRKDRDESRPYGSFDLMRRDLTAIIREQGIDPIDCYDYIPKDSLFFSDMRLHPNDMGFEHYSDNLCRIITSRLEKEN